MIASIFETKKILQNIDKYIANSHYKVEYIVKELGITSATYYRKLKAKKFEVEELEKIFTILYPDEAEKYKLNELIEASIKEADKGLCKTQEEIMSDYDRLYLGK